MKTRQFLLLCWFLMACFSSAWAQKEKIPPYPVKFQVESFQKAQRRYLAVSFQNADHWHTYWRNPGESGQPLSLTFSLGGREFSPKALPWPTPETFLESGQIQTFGYQGDYTLFYELGPSIAKMVLTEPLTVRGKWLVCKHICIPGKGVAKGQLGQGPLGFPVDFSQKTNWQKHWEALPKKGPKPEEAKFFLTTGAEESGLIIHYQIPREQIRLEKKLNVLYPFDHPLISFGREEVYVDQETGLVHGKIPLTWDGIYQEPAVKLPANGQLPSPINFRFLLQLPERSVSFQAPFAQYEKLPASLKGDFYQGLTAKEHLLVAPSAGGPSYLTYLIFALIGGFILNFMPCVLPVISLKLFGLIKHKEFSHRQLVRHNLLYSAGVILSFMALALVVAMIKTAGIQVGWGFHMQSPTFLVVMIIILGIFALNLFGLFEFKAPLGQKLGGIQFKEGPVADFSNGVLATILSTPCSAPFLGTALTFAFTTTLFNIFSIFFMVGVGLALPFLITSIFPQVASILPAPGQWMNTFKKFLGVTLLLTMVWLGDVLYTVLDPSHQSAQVSSKQKLPWRPWSPPAMKELKGELVFIDFTADWCFTCKVNEKLVLNTDGFAKLVKKYEAKLLLGDWTRRDDTIASFLREQGLVGVPAYFVQGQDGSLAYLGETISLGEIEKAFQQAQ